MSGSALGASRLPFGAARSKEQLYPANQANQIGCESFKSDGQPLRFGSLVLIHASTTARNSKAILRISPASVSRATSIWCGRSRSACDGIFRSSPRTCPRQRRAQARWNRTPLCDGRSWRPRGSPRAISMCAVRSPALYAVANRRSAERAARFAPARSRATNARMSSSSVFEVRWR